MLRRKHAPRQQPPRSLGVRCAVFDHTSALPESARGATFKGANVRNDSVVHSSTHVTLLELTSRAEDTNEAGLFGLPRRRLASVEEMPAHLKRDTLAIERAATAQRRAMWWQHHQKLDDSGETVAPLSRCAPLVTAARDTYPSFVDCRGAGSRIDPEWDIESLLACFDHTVDRQSHSECVSQLHRALVADESMEADAVDILTSPTTVANMELSRVHHLATAVATVGSQPAQDALVSLLNVHGARSRAVQHAVVASHSVPDPLPRLGYALLALANDLDARKLHFEDVKAPMAGERSTSSSNNARCVALRVRFEHSSGLAKPRFAPLV